MDQCLVNVTALRGQVTIGDEVVHPLAGKATNKERLMHWLPGLARAMRRL
jgi:hypothetical protein